MRYIRISISEIRFLTVCSNREYVRTLLLEEIQKLSGIEPPFKD